MEALLVAADLPTAGVAEHFETFFVAEEGARIVGAAGLEMHGGYALLRSVVVAPDAKRAGIGGTLTLHALAAARAVGAKAVYLLTTTAEAFFPRFGFEVIARTDVPPDVQASKEFQGACPASATVMRCAL
ncbi:arsenic resistance N-acetyltransferase ArsN2 [Pendulispora brunnea]|uniref:Arsenic resistance N-acetyltransferase ArsN2 n=1 Tax=Pendulispora brunnea TaxID=2905690 RepID=A0ABZ2KR88_9BACT